MNSIAKEKHAHALHQGLQQIMRECLELVSPESGLHHALKECTTQGYISSPFRERLGGVLAQLQIEHSDHPVLRSLEMILKLNLAPLEEPIGTRLNLLDGNLVVMEIDGRGINRGHWETPINSPVTITLWPNIMTIRQPGESAAEAQQRTTSEEMSMSITLLTTLAYLKNYGHEVRVMTVDEKTRKQLRRMIKRHRQDWGDGWYSVLGEIRAI